MKENSSGEERSLRDREVHLPAGTELLCPSGRQTTEVRGNQSAEPDPPLLLNPEVVSGMLPRKSNARAENTACTIRNVCEAAREKAHALAKTPQFAARCERRKVEAELSELKNLVGLRRLRLRRIKFVREQFYLAAVAQNLKRLVRFLSYRPQLIQASN